MEGVWFWRAPIKVSDLRGMTVEATSDEGPDPNAFRTCMVQLYSIPSAPSW